MSFRVSQSLAKLRKSWTLWVNLISVLLAGAEAQFNLLEPYMGEKTYGAALFGLVLINIALRFKTEMAHQKALSEKGQV